MASFLGFLAALPKLLVMIEGFMGWINKMSGNDPAGFILKAGEVFKKLGEAKTEGEHAASAKALAELISNLPRR